ncbi:calcineurin-binding protein 1 [Jatropha curcas]|uniref:calcineurin-binding protein 1 n=1 Tax=Jatropha curcas TaxID=180498 RepID=UPI0018962464|nr:calcineurin-binding protein 1 [Jatropha curcas]
MFSIAAINDTDSRKQWEPLAPTKEAQEFHLTQTYHEGLLKLQSKEYDKARELLESVLKDPLISNAQVDSNASDGHLQQLRFLALKNLATVFLRQGSTHYESALHCYLQAVEIDTKDSVIWNQLGTLSCSMGLLTISRWAFEQGLLCSPNNWNCMEKLLEVLIAIGDEVACLSVAELILRHWPSHSRALYVKNTIEESDPVPFAPRGIDKLEPKHVRLKFVDKRKTTDENVDESTACKKLKQNIELCLPEASWAALADALLEILLPLNGRESDMRNRKEYRSGDVRLTLHFSSCLDIPTGSTENKGLKPIASESLSVRDFNSDRASFVKEREANASEEHIHERRSTRLERLRSRKPGKEELDFAASKDLAKAVLQSLEPFIVSGLGTKYSDQAASHSVSCPDQANSLDMEHNDVSAFVREASKNYGAYHMGHLLLEHVAVRSLPYQDAFVKFLDLERLTRQWGQDRTPECSLFLAELYYELGFLPSNASKLPEFLSEASYHLGKIIESVALDYPFHSNHLSGNEICSSPKSFLDNNELFAKDSNSQDSFFNSSLVTNKNYFWVRYFWLSGKLSIYDGNKAKAHEEFCISLSLLAKKEQGNDFPCSVHLPHLKINKELTVNRVLHEINLLKVDFLLEKTVGEMLGKEMYTECINLLAPLLFSTEHVHLDILPSSASDKTGEGFASIELSAIDLLINACEQTKPKDNEVHLNCHRRKLQILILAAGMDEYKTLCQKYGLNVFSTSDFTLKENPDNYWNDLVMEEVKAISQYVAQLKMDPSLKSNGVIIPTDSIGDIQTLLLAVMCHIAINCFCKRSLAPADETEQKQGFCFVDAGIAFCKLQHLIPSVPVKTQVQLIVAMHDLLAEYGLCCASEGGKGEEGTFLKFAIKHLLALDVKLKSNLNSSNKETIQHDKQNSPCNQNKTCKNELKSDTLDVETGGIEIDEMTTVDTDVFRQITSKVVPCLEGAGKDDAGVEFEKQGSNERKGKTHQFTECRTELTEDEREELELIIDSALDQCFFCLYGLNLRSDSSYEDDLAIHKNTSRGDYQTKEQCADVFQYILPYAKASSRTGLVKLRRVLRAICKHFPQPPEDVLTGNAIDKFLDDPDLCEDRLSEEAGSEGYLETITKIIFPNMESVKQDKPMLVASPEQYLDVYCNLYYFLAMSEEMNATDKWPGFVLTKEGEEFVQQNAKLFKYDLLYNPLRFESWQRLANIYDEEVDLLLNDGSKHINVAGWRKNATLPQRVETSRRRSRRCLLVSLALAKTSAQQVHPFSLLCVWQSFASCCRYLHRYIASLERNGKLETLEAINEKIRKRFKNPKLSNSNCAKVCKHASVAWCRSLIIGLALITPLRPRIPSEIQALNPSDNLSENSQVLCVDLQTNEFWNSAFEDSTHLDSLETKWNPVLAKIKNVIIQRASDENLETANSLLRSSYNFFRESACVMPPSGLNLYLVPTRISMETQLQPGLNGVEILDLSIPRKLLLWAYTLLHGRYANISIVLKHCEENIKSKMKKGAGTLSMSSNASLTTTTSVHTAIGGAKDSASHGGGSEPDIVVVAAPMSASVSAPSSESENTQFMDPSPPSSETRKSFLAALQLNLNDTNPVKKEGSTAHEGDQYRG